MDDMNAEALAARADEASLENFIARSKRYILVCASRTVGRYLTESDDEWSVALLAFTEAVREYDGEKGSFSSFAAMVIRRRLVDYLRTESRHAGEIPVEPESMDGDGEDLESAPPLLRELRAKNVENAEAAASDGDARTEIEAVQELLKGYGFTFFELTGCSPKAGKTKKLCTQAVGALIGSSELFLQMRKTKNLPIREICEQSGVPRKILERHRKYIIAAAEILRGDYPIISGYLSDIKSTLGGNHESSRIGSS